MGATALLILVSLVLGAGAWLLFLWAVSTDQYDDVERPKHRMMDDDPDPKPAPAPGILNGDIPRKEGDDA